MLEKSKHKTGKESQRTFSLCGEASKIFAGIVALTQYLQHMAKPSTDNVASDARVFCALVQNDIGRVAERQFIAAVCT